MTADVKSQPKSTRKAKGEGHLRRAEILQAAERIFVADGYEGATIRKIADEVGVSSTALYMHFRDKSEILLEICADAIGQLLALNTEIAARPIDPVTRVRAMLEAYIRFAMIHPNAYQLVFCTKGYGLNGDQEGKAKMMGEACFQKFKGVVSEIAAVGRLRTGTVDSAAQTLWAACHGLVALVITKPDFEWAPMPELEKVMLDGLFHGLVID